MCVLFLHHSLLKYFGFNDIFCWFFFIPTGYFYSIELMKKKIIRTKYRSLKRWIQGKMLAYVFYTTLLPVHEYVVLNLLEQMC